MQDISHSIESIRSLAERLWTHLPLPLFLNNLCLMLSVFRHVKHTTRKEGEPTHSSHQAKHVAHIRSGHPQQSHFIPGTLK